MSTPTWPVPYYERAYRHASYNPDHMDGDLETVAVDANDNHVILAKELLKAEGNGHVVEAVEQHFDVSSYVTSFKNSEQFCTAYTDDLLDCLGVAREQNVRLLAEHDLADVFN